MGLKIMVVDDDEVVLFLHREILEQCNIPFPSVCFNSARQALSEILLDEGGNTWLVLLDINMPVMNGWDLLEELQKEKSKKVYVVIVTSSIDPDDREKAKKYNQVIDYFEKPISPESVINLMRSPLFNLKI
jgi:CheY-like chemotaxis protein